MIEIHDVTNRYGSTLAVDRLSFEVRDGEVTGFLDPNGAGNFHHHADDGGPRCPHLGTGSPSTAAPAPTPTSLSPWPVVIARVDRVSEPPELTTDGGLVPAEGGNGLLQHREEQPAGRGMRLPP